MRPTFNQIRQLGDPALTNTWYLQFTKTPNAVPFDGQELNFRCESTGIPKKTGEKITVQIRGLTPIHYPGTVVPEGEMTFNFFETEDNAITKIVNDLREATQDSNTGAGRLKKDLEFNLRIVRLNKNNKEIWEYQLVGCFFVSGEPGGELTGGNAESLKPTMTISYDNYFEGPPGFQAPVN